MTQMAIDYSARATNGPRPAELTDYWVDAHLSLDHADEAARASGRTFWADISVFQPVVSKRYPWRMLAYRVDNGYEIDQHGIENHRVCDSWDQIEVQLGYCVFKPGESGSILSRLKRQYGQHPSFYPMVDMESGPGFAGPGNHSSEANDFMAELAAWTGRPSGQVGYANGGDWSSNWPNHPAGMHRILADYTSNVPSGWWGVQYYGGMNYPTPSGWPRAVAPFGSWVDLNSAPMSIDAIKESLGTGDWFSMATKADLKEVVEEVLQEHGLAGFSTGWDKHRHTLETFLAGIPGYRTTSVRRKASQKKTEAPEAQPDPLDESNQ